MPHVTDQQLKILGMYPQSREGLGVGGADAMIPAACWNFALTGTVILGNNPKSPEKIYEGDDGMLDVEWKSADEVVIGLRPTATEANHPDCAKEIFSLQLNFPHAMRGIAVAQESFQRALMKIVARKNGLIPAVNNDKYQLHMKATTWFGWDHWALSLRTPQGSRVYIQTTTGTPLKHACDRVWDEELFETTIDIQELHQAQIDYINMIGHGVLGVQCVECGSARGFAPINPAHKWHRCTQCGAIYCHRHSQALAVNNQARVCGQPNCQGRTEVVAPI